VKNGLGKIYLPSTVATKAIVNGEIQDDVASNWSEERGAKQKGQLGGERGARLLNRAALLLGLCMKLCPWLLCCMKAADSFSQ